MKIVEMTIPGKRNSRLQKYRLTRLGERIARQVGKSGHEVVDAKNGPDQKPNAGKLADDG